MDRYPIIENKPDPSLLTPKRIILPVRPCYLGDRHEPGIERTMVRHIFPHLIRT